MLSLTIHFGLLFVVDALTTLIAALTLFCFSRKRRLETARPSNRSAPLPASPLRDGQFLVFLLLMLATSMVFFQFMSSYPLYLRDHFQLDKPWIGAMFAVNTSVIVVFEMVLLDFVKRWPLLRTIGWGCFLSCLGFGMLPFGSSVAFCAIAMLVVTVGEMLSLPLSSGLTFWLLHLGSPLHRAAPAARRGQAHGKNEPSE